MIFAIKFHFPFPFAPGLFSCIVPDWIPRDDDDLNQISFLRNREIGAAPSESGDDIRGEIVNMAADIAPHIDIQSSERVNFRGIEMFSEYTSPFLS